ncbi:MAG TPA: hypothetical protein VFN26_19710 [Candidatus Acidoferrum sp.]|nr:hypothetical protein [Candidatus Acidoferrum sp.]
MEKKEISNMEEAQELLLRLEQFYKEPVLRLDSFCQAMELWMDCIVKNNTDPALMQGGLAHGKTYFKSLNHMRIDIRKSNLLGRLLFAKEPLRTRMCPLHKGHYNGQAMFFEKCPHLCDGTGWLREREQDGGYTGISIQEGKIEGGEFKVRDPETGEWKKLE